MKVELNAVPHEECIQKYRSKGITLTENQLCAGGEKGKDACKGESWQSSFFPNWINNSFPK